MRPNARRRLASAQALLPLEEVAGDVVRLDAIPAVDKKRKHDLELVVDRLTVDRASRARLAEAVELGLREGKGELVVEIEGKAPLRFSSERSCCGQSYPEPSPQSFSFNSPLGMCAACNGLGVRTEIAPELVVPDPKRSIRAGAIAPWATSMERGDGWTFRTIEALAKGSAAAVAPLLGRDRTEKWLQARRDAERVITRHQDLLALPR